MRRLLVLALGVVLLTAGSARAAYDPGAEIDSVDNARQEQGDDGVIAATMTSDGRYVVFQTRASNFFADDDPDPPDGMRQGGIFRYDRATGALALVADGDLVSPLGDVLVRGASNPSISADGRYVAFSTGQRLVAGDANDNVDVYVRDMSVPVGDDRVASGAYRLVSARDSGDQPATYAHPDDAPPAVAEQRNPGADVWPGNAISADGRYVAFRTVEWNSDLPDSLTSTVAPGQVLVRDVAAKRTYLLSRTTFEGGATTLGEPAGGAVGPIVISADGTAVSWVGSNAQAQTRFVNGESSYTGQRYYLLRRWQGASPATIRFAGAADPADPSCSPDGIVSTDANALGPCDGPLTEVESGNQNSFLPAPALSADGTKVAYLATGSRRPLQTAENNPGLDLFYVDLGAGPSLKRTTIELTRDGQNTDRRATSAIDAVSITRDGRYIGITTFRDLFVLPVLSPVGSFRPQPNAREGYVIDLRQATIERVQRASDGSDGDGSIDGPLSMSNDAGLVAAVSEASNLFFGDANGVADAFVFSRTPLRSTAPPPAGINRQSSTFDIGTQQGTSPKAVRVKVAHRTDGSLTLEATVAAAGRVVAIARRATGKSGSRARTGPVIGRTTGRASKAGRVRLSLRLLHSYAKRLRPGGRMSARIVVTWSPAPPAIPSDATVTATFIRAKSK